MNSFVCPHNESVTILEHCPITECPYHVQQVSKLFTLDEEKTGCVYHDTDMMANVSDSRTQISALSRDKRRQVSPKSIKTIYEDALTYMRTLYELTHSISSTKHYCKNCGYLTTNNKMQCVSTTICESRKQWVKMVVSKYALEDESAPKYSLIWELLLTNKIHLEESALEIGRSLCSQRDLREYKTMIINQET